MIHTRLETALRSFENEPITETERHNVLYLKSNCVVLGGGGGVRSVHQTVCSLDNSLVAHSFRKVGEGSLSPLSQHIRMNYTVYLNLK